MRPCQSSPPSMKIIIKRQRRRSPEAKGERRPDIPSCGTARKREDPSVGHIFKRASTNAARVVSYVGSSTK